MTAAFRLSAFGEGENTGWQRACISIPLGDPLHGKKIAISIPPLLLKIAAPIDSSKQGTGLAMPNLETTEVPKSER